MGVSAVVLLGLFAAIRVCDSNLATPALFHITTQFFDTGDAFWLVCLAALLAAGAAVRTPAGLSDFRFKEIAPRPTALVAALAVFVLLCSFLGVRFAALGFPVSRDEFLADFDATILRAGFVVAPVAEEWRRFVAATALPAFMQPVADHAALGSAYLPGNAMLRALTSLWFDRQLTGGLLAALAVVAGFGVARRLWPSRPDAAVVVAVLLATSPQVIVTAMTPYAMTAHLALNLVWLWFFLRDDKIGHAGAIATGFFASGLHQVVFHPMFAAPFVFSMWRKGRRTLAYVYVAAYALIGLFWIEYWQIALALEGFARPDAGPDGASVDGAEFFLSKVKILFVDYEGLRAPLMLKNLARFLTWQNAAMAPLAPMVGTVELKLIST